MQQLSAHEVMELHELLDDKICMIDHFAMYIGQCQDPQLRNMIQSHQQRTLQDYQMTLSMVQGHSRQPGNMSTGMHAGMATGGGITSGMGNASMTMAMSGGQGQSQVHHEMGQTQHVPHPNNRSLSDQSIAQGCLTFHKCGATRATMAALESGNSQLRNMFSNSARACTDMAYDIFQYMNQRGWYLSPAMHPNQMEQMFNSYQMPQQMMGQQQMAGQQGTVGQHQAMGQQALGMQQGDNRQQSGQMGQMNMGQMGQQGQRHQQGNFTSGQMYS